MEERREGEKRRRGGKGKLNEKFQEEFLQCLTKEFFSFQLSLV